MSRRGGAGGKRGRGGKDVWDVEGGYMGVKMQKLEEQFRQQVVTEVMFIIIPCCAGKR
jgi:hypothetical protein